MYEREGNVCAHEETYTGMMKIVWFQITRKTILSKMACMTNVWYHTMQQLTAMK